MTFGLKVTDQNHIFSGTEERLLTNIDSLISIRNRWLK